MYIAQILLLAAAATSAEAYLDKCWQSSSFTYFWPLNEDAKGSNYCYVPNSDLVLTNTVFGHHDTCSKWSYPPVDFNHDSYAELSHDASSYVTRSFSWIAAVNRTSTTDGPLFEWDDDGDLSTHIWIFENKFFVNVQREGCPEIYKSHSSTVVDNKWTIFAVSYDADTSTVSMYVDGKKEHATGEECAGNTKTGTKAYINKRLDKHAFSEYRLDAEITCMGVFSQAQEYEFMHDSVIVQCY